MLSLDPCVFHIGLYIHEQSLPKTLFVLTSGFAAKWTLLDRTEIMTTISLYQYHSSHNHKEIHQPYIKVYFFGIPCKLINSKSIPLDA